MFKVKDQDIMFQKAKMKLTPTNHVDSIDLIVINEEKEKVVAKKLELECKKVEL